MPPEVEDILSEVKFAVFWHKKNTFITGFLIKGNSVNQVKLTNLTNKHNHPVTIKVELSLQNVLVLNWNSLEIKS